MVRTGQPLIKHPLEEGPDRQGALGVHREPLPGAPADPVNKI